MTCSLYKFSFLGFGFLSLFVFLSCLLINKIIYFFLLCSLFHARLHIAYLQVCPMHGVSSAPAISKHTQCTLASPCLCFIPPDSVSVFPSPHHFSSGLMSLTITNERKLRPLYSAVTQKAKNSTTIQDFHCIKTSRRKKNERREYEIAVSRKKCCASNQELNSLICILEMTM